MQGLSQGSGNNGSSPSSSWLLTSRRDWATILSTPARCQDQRRFKHLCPAITPDLHCKLDQVAIRHLIARYVVQDSQGLRSGAVARLEILAVIVENLAVTIVNIEKI